MKHKPLDSYSHTAKEETVKMEQENTSKEKYENLVVGEDKPQVSVAKVVIEDYRVEAVKNKKGEEIGDKLVLICKHPEVTDKNIEISGVKYESGDKIKQSGLWFKLDSDGKLPFNSATANLLRFYKKETVKQMKGEQVDTIADDNGYLLVKAY